MKCQVLFSLKDKKTKMFKKKKKKKMASAAIVIGTLKVR